MPDLTSNRQLALQVAADLHRQQFAIRIDRGDLDGANLGVRSTATALYHWLIGPALLHVHVGPVRNGAGQIIPTITKGNAVQLRIADPQGRPYECDLTVTVRDALGNEITDDPSTPSDDLTWTLDSGEGVVDLAISADTRMCTVTAAQIGSAVVRVALGELTGTVAVDVIAGDAAELAIVEGTPRPRPDTEPEPVS